MSTTNKIKKLIGEGNKVSIQKALFNYWVRESTEEPKYNLPYKD